MTRPVVRFEIHGEDGSRLQDIPEGPTMAQLADPEGNVIGLVKQ